MSLYSARSATGRASDLVQILICGCETKQIVAVLARFAVAGRLVRFEGVWFITIESSLTTIYQV